MPLRLVIIVLAVVGIAFVAFMLVGSNDREPGDEDREEPPQALAVLDTEGGAPRLVEEEITFPRDSGEALAMSVGSACGTPARLATVAIVAGASVRVAYACREQPPDQNCSGPSILCDQALCLVASEGARGLSGCPENREFVGEANLSVGPEPGRLTIVPPFGQAAAVTLR